MGALVYTGVYNGKVAMVAVDRSMIPEAFDVVRGYFDAELLGVIHVADDGSEAARVCLEQKQPVGLGWSFR